MTPYLTELIVIVAYFSCIIGISFIISKKNKTTDAHEFLSGKKSTNWFRAGMAAVGVSSDGMLALAGISFLFGFHLQWNAITFLIAAPFAAMFFMPVYWHSGIVTLPDYLEKRFNTASRTLFSIIMTICMIVSLSLPLYFGALLLNHLFNWNLYADAIMLVLIAIIYVSLGGMKTVIRINVFQSIFMLTLFVLMAAISLYVIGGLKGMININIISLNEHKMPSTLPAFDWRIDSDKFFPLPAVLFWSPILCIAWISTSYQTIQRMLTTRTLKDAQKGIYLFGILNIFTCIIAYIVGIAAKKLLPNVAPDNAYLTMILTYCPTFLKGLMLAAILAALVSAIDGSLTASSSLFMEDIFLKYISPKANNKRIIFITRIFQFCVVILALLVFSVILKQRSAMEFIQKFISFVLAVIIALFLTGIFSRRTTSRAALIGGIFGILLSTIAFFTFKINFAYTCLFVFLSTSLMIILLSFFETPQNEEQLKNLTIFTIPGVKGPFAGHHSWPGLWKWTLIIILIWVAFIYSWEVFIIK